MKGLIWIKNKICFGSDVITVCTVCFAVFEILRVSTKLHTPAKVEATD
jgi:hypothetical protein